uniref:ATP synthase complex subunit 8 n=1 Tax=Cryptobatrachus sp. TNHC-GDC 451 TaxID=1338817 RepID=S4V1M0_9NEOB|nr:ATP synthase F0 subunit 8 [Cryptobatrachus sp. TNHC-GDC 451]
MPQLNPSPWLLTLLSSWLILLLLMMTKISKYMCLNNPLAKFFKNNCKTWTWPWL